MDGIVSDGIVFGWDEVGCRINGTKQISVRYRLIIFDFLFTAFDRVKLVIDFFTIHYANIFFYY